MRKVVNMQFVDATTKYAFAGHGGEESWLFSCIKRTLSSRFTRVDCILRVEWIGFASTGFASCGVYWASYATCLHRSKSSHWVFEPLMLRERRIQIETAAQFSGNPQSEQIRETCLLDGNRLSNRTYCRFLEIYKVTPMIEIRSEGRDNLIACSGFAPDDRRVKRHLSIHSKLIRSSIPDLLICV